MLDILVNMPILAASTEKGHYMNYPEYQFEKAAERERARAYPEPTYEEPKPFIEETPGAVIDDLVTGEEWQQHITEALNADDCWLIAHSFRHGGDHHIGLIVRQAILREAKAIAARVNAKRAEA